MLRNGNMRANWPTLWNLKSSSDVYAAKVDLIPLYLNRDPQKRGVPRLSGTALHAEDTLYVANAHLMPIARPLLSVLFYGSSETPYIWRGIVAETV